LFANVVAAYDLVFGAGFLLAAAILGIPLPLHPSFGFGFDQK